jgi:phosphatidylglycerol---prolipoprotein diacylglyceryl transferase
VKTRLEPFIRVPGTLPFSWVGMVTLGMIVAVVVQSLLLAHNHIAVGPAVVATLIAIAVGIAGAKVWYIVKHRRERSFIGWCIQGFFTGASVAAIIMFAIVHAPLGTVLDATAPGLMLGMAVGRVGCFFAGCCGGPPTASRWGVWCSDQNIGARRIPTQLMESVFALALGLGLVVLAAVLAHGFAGGVYFIVVLAAYTLFREGVLRLRAEPLTTRLPVPATPFLSALVLIAAIVVLVR